MAVDINNVAYGAAVVSIGAYVSGGSAGTLTDVGLTMDAVELTDAVEDFRPEFEQTQAPPLSIPTSRTVSLKLKMAEMDLDKLQQVLRQASGNLTGVAPNKTLAVDQEQEAYLQVQVVAKGIKGSTGTAATRTITLWRCVPSNRGAIPFAKGNVQNLELQFDVLEDTSISAGGSGQFYKIADSGAA